MCFFNKKNPKSEDTAEDKIRIKMQNGLYEKESFLRGRVSNALARAAAISVYPEGADKDAARAELDAAQKLVLCQIGEYDLARQELETYINNNTFKTTVKFPKGDRLSKSHNIVKSACEQFYGVGKTSW